MFKLFIGTLLIAAAIAQGTAETLGTELCLFSGIILIAFGADNVLSYIINKVNKHLGK